MNKNRMDSPVPEKKRSPYAIFFSRLLKAALLIACIAIVAFAAFVFKRLKDSKSMEPIAITQCFEPFDRPFGRKNEFYKDQERGCYGQRWVMPRAYFDRVSHSSTSETLVVNVARPGIGPGNLLPSEQFASVYHSINIKPARSGKFEDHIRQTQDAYGTTSGLVKTARELYGMDVYEQTKIGLHQYHDFFLFPSANAQLFVKCLLKPDTTIDQKSPNGSCDVIANVDDRVSITYHINYSEMPDLINVNATVIGLIRSFMRN